jgi:DNA-binding transcriptional ArsR family regulator
MVRGLTVEQHLQRLREGLLPAAERCGRMVREAIAALEALRALPAKLSNDQSRSASRSGF